MDRKEKGWCVDENWNNNPEIGNRLESLKKGYYCKVYDIQTDWWYLVQDDSCNAETYNTP